LVRAGHNVVVYERAERPGGLLRYGIPEFKMEKAVLDRRLAQLRAEGVEFRCGIAVGSPDAASPTSPLPAPWEPGQRRGLGGASAPDVRVVSASSLQTEFDAVVLAGGATLPRDLSVEGRELDGVHLAMDYLKPSNLVREGALASSPITAQGKRVVIIGGGDTGADCLGTAHRQGASLVHQLEILPRPPDGRLDDNPWPTWPLILRTSAAHEEGGDRIYSVTTTAFVDDGHGAVRALAGHRVELRDDGGRPAFAPVPGSEFELPCELVLLALGFLGAERSGVVGELGLELDPRGSVACDSDWQTSRDGVFVCGQCRPFHHGRHRAAGAVGARATRLALKRRGTRRRQAERLTGLSPFFDAARASGAALIGSRTSSSSSSASSTSTPRAGPSGAAAARYFWRRPSSLTTLARRTASVSMLCCSSSIWRCASSIIRSASAWAFLTAAALTASASSSAFSPASSAARRMSDARWPTATVAASTAFSARASESRSHWWSRST
jgi:NADPH-dependent glutamate synthase beta subunit-like oxidoreductase